MWGCPPQQRSPFSWPGEGGQVEDYARRGDEVEQLVDLASIGWKSPLDRRLRSRVATRPFQFTGIEERNTPNLNCCPTSGPALTSPLAAGFVLGPPWTPNKE
jgi:hypothetical protein